MSAILAVHDLQKSFGSVIAAHDINVAVPALQTVGIIGANGAGKTTFVNMITGHLRPTSRHDHFDGRDITGLPSRAITRLGIARSFQMPQIFASLTVQENMCAATAIAHAGGGLLQQVVTPLYARRTLADSEAALELFRIAGYRRIHCRDTASGRAQAPRHRHGGSRRAARVLLLDEPTSGISIEEKFSLWTW